MSKTKSYIELFLDNAYSKKGEIYFGDVQEAAIVEYNTTECMRTKNKLFADTIDICFKKTVAGVLEMPKFRTLPKGIDTEELIHNTYFRLVEKIYKFEDGMISKKTGLPVKAYSYFSTIAKNFVLETIKKHNKVIENKADVESSIDLSILSDETSEIISNSNVENEGLLNDYVSVFEHSKDIIISVVNKMISIEEETKSNSDFLKVSYCLKYLLENWSKFEFDKRSEFMRLLTLYTGLNQQRVSFLFKKIKNEVLQKIDINNNSNKKVPVFFEDEVKDEFETEDEPEFDDEEIMDDIDAEEEKLNNYIIYSLEEFESIDSKITNINTRKEWQSIRNCKTTMRN